MGMEGGDGESTDEVPDVKGFALIPMKLIFTAFQVLDVHHY